MHNIGTYILCTLAVCTLCHGSFAEDLQGVDAKLEGQLREVQVKLEGQLQALQTKVEESETKVEGSLVALELKLDTVLSQLQAVSKKIDAAKLEIPDLVMNSVPFGFERIATRYFRIVNQLESWESAERKCREMGGYLASFRNEEEVTAITARLEEFRGYWLGSNDRKAEGHFISVASDRPAQFLIWQSQNPEDETHRQNCVALQRGRMYDYDCSTHKYFICQADNKS